MLRPTLRIRPISICVFRHAGRILVEAGFDPQRRESFYRPLGGALKFGEHSQAGVRREIREELGEEIELPRLLGILENIFEYEGRPGHEIIFVYDALFCRRELYAQLMLNGRESDGEPIEAVWRELSTFESGPPLYPTGLMELLNDRQYGKNG